VAAPENLDFEIGDPGLIPEGWSASKYLLANFGYAVETSTEEPFQGSQCVKISRDPGEYYGETSASLSQRLDATAYHGKQIRLRGAVRTDLEGPESHAYMWLSVTRRGFGPDADLFEDNMSDRPIASEEWGSFEIAGEVAPEAEYIIFGMAMVGEGRAWYDAFTLEVIP
jgi:hypothetical protein